MKRILALLAAALAPLAFAATVVTETPGTSDLYQGEKKISVQPNYAACLAKAQSFGIMTVFTCRTSTTIMLRDVVPPKPANETQTLTCPAGSTGQWTQVRTYNAAPAPVYWQAGAWTPSAAPAGACSVVIPPQPKGEFQMLSCPAGATTGAQWRQDRDYVSAPAPTFWTPGPWLPTTPQAGACPPAPPPPHMHAGLALDPTSFMTPYAGRTVDMVGGSNVPPIDPANLPVVGFDGSGAFRNICVPVKMGFFDPIVYPGVPDTSHGHVFVGNAGIDWNSTADNMFADSFGESCRGGTINRGAYWQPIMVDLKTMKAKKPRIFIIYYKVSPWTDHKQIQEIPRGLKIIAGNPAATEPVRFSPVGFQCDGFAQGTESDPWPQAAGPHSIPLMANCGVGHEVWAVVTFPPCWDGKNLDSPDHKSHMAYTSSPFTPVTLSNGCEPDHPILLPQLSVFAVYPIVAGDNIDDWGLASDSYLFDTLADGTKVRNKKLAGYSIHADGFLNWKPEFQKVWREGCLIPSRDCFAHLLGDGRTMIGFDGN